MTHLVKNYIAAPKCSLSKLFFRPLLTVLVYALHYSGTLSYIDVDLGLNLRPSPSEINTTHNTITTEELLH